MIFASFFKAVGQIGDPRFRKVLLLGVGLTLALLIATYAGVLWLIQAAVGDSTTLPLLGEVTWLGDLLSGASFLLMIVLSVFLMVPVASAITSMFLDEVAQAVEDRHYPHLTPASIVPFGEALRDTINFLGVIIGANIVALLLYAIFTPFALFIFWALNGYLLGMEYFQLVAMRRVGREGAKTLRRKHRMTIWAAGVLMAMPLSVPLVNLLIPILGAATFTHIFHATQVRRHSSG
ncbi:EI24 domain-containing protein [Roseovarius sp. 217]|uniref:EI24 domain-containing protein n=1 Tax=Roseovarius sp. (strain 217) TaxID=314264 RepID=UPI0000684DB9|nr:EI24 domain-containing protein [Roseovarius sp. 217]EAQ25395.1 membrane protein, putative [Roseovarius sp. 217]